MKHFLWLVFTVMILPGGGAELVHAQVSTQAQPVTLVIDGIDGPVKDNVLRNVRLAARLTDEELPSPAEIRRLQTAVIAEVIAAVEPYGYYGASVRYQNSDVPGELRYQVALGEPVRVRSLEISLSGPGRRETSFIDWQRQFGLNVNDVLNQTVYQARKKSVLADALRLGYFDARFTRKRIAINETNEHADIELAFETGQRYSVAKVRYQWLGEEVQSELAPRLHEQILQALTTIRAGDLYDADQLIATQQNLSASNYFSAVSARTTAFDRDQATLEVLVELALSNHQIYGFEVGAGTDTGVRGGVGFENRLLNRSGHTLGARIGASEIRRSAILNYRLPVLRRPSDSLNFFASFDQELGNSRQFDSVRLGSELALKWRDALLKFGLTGSRETFNRLNKLGIDNKITTTLVIPSLRWDRSSSDNRWYPTRGWSAAATLRGSSEDLLSDIDLVQLILDAKLLRPLGQGRFKARLKAGTSLIDDDVELPESLGFLAGGDDSVRGYRFESIGELRNGETVVGKNLMVASLEYQYPLRDGWALASFIDIGDAFDRDPDYKKGVGIGVRWRLPFGALRLDMASALDREGNPWRVHFNIGTDL